MKLKYLALIGVLCAGIASLARADLTFLGDFALANADPDTGLAKFQEVTGDSDATVCARLDTEDPFPGDPQTVGAFTFSFGQNANGQFTVTVDWDLSNTGQVVCGFLTKDGGGNHVFLYEVSAAEGVSGSFTLLVPPNNSQFGQLSHIDVFCCPGGTTTPDSGTTAMLLGGALTGLGVVRRYLKR